MVEAYMSNEKTQTGINIVDQLLDGGIPRGSSVLIRTNPLSDPSTIAIQLLRNRLRSGDIGVYFVSNKSANAVIDESVSLGMSLAEYKQQNRLFFIDGYSALFGLNSEEAYAVDNSYDCNSVFSVVTKALYECGRKGKVFFIYDSLNTSIDEFGGAILGEVDNWKKIAVTFNAILCFLYTEWNYENAVSQTVSSLYPTIIDLMALERIVGNQAITVSKKGGVPVKEKIIPIKRSVTGEIKGYIPKILVTGPFHAGKTTIVHALSTRAVSVQRFGTTVALDFGHVDYKGFTLDLFGTVGQPRFDPILKLLGGEALGAILVVDSTKPEEFPRAKEMMLKAKVNGLPYVVAANKQDLPKAMSASEIKIKMNIPNDVEVIGTVGNDKASSIGVLDSLIEKILCGD
ncbi:MAG: ADP-ribosylation factor-like protein [Candidatus Bathyarchaeota archaeon]|nr:ADP-ribosylation factor-like protein [Candidatus Bathyarchaeota archaeon]